MCEHCVSGYESIKERKLSLKEVHNYKTLGWIKLNNYRVHEGFALRKGKYTIIVDNDYIQLYNEKLNGIDNIKNNNYVENIVKLIDRRIKSKYYETLKEAPKRKMNARMWTAHLPIDEKTCDVCKALHGQVRGNKYKFFVPIKNQKTGAIRVYPIYSPPLHWVFKKDGSRKDTCRCSPVQVVDDERYQTAEYNKKWEDYLDSIGASKSKWS
jgi:hypothetical protein